MITVETPAFDVETLEVRIVDKGLFPVYMNSFYDWLILTIKVSNQAIENYLL